MPRTARVVLSNYPHHIIQRGHNRQTVFAATRDYERYLDNLREWKTAFGCRVYAYCLMTNHVHLIVDPGENPGSLALLMKRLAGRQTRYVNHLEARTGSLWGKPLQIPAPSEKPTVTCSPAVGMSSSIPSVPAWSPSPRRTRGRATATNWGWRRRTRSISIPCYLALGDDPSKRVARYREFVHQAIPQNRMESNSHRSPARTAYGAVRDSSRKSPPGWSRRVQCRGRGRPKRQENKSPSPLSRSPPSPLYTIRSKRKGVRNLSSDKKKGA